MTAAQPATVTGNWAAVARAAACNYFCVQGAAAALWWITLALYPASRPWFFPGAQGGIVMSSIAIADILAFALGSVVAGIIIRVRPTLAPLAAGAALGIGLYAALLSLGTLLTGTGTALALTIMLGSLAATCASVLLVVDPASVSRLFRVAQPAPISSMAWRTTLQSAILWGTFLIILPLTLAAIERRAGVPPLTLGEPLDAWFPIIGACVILLASSLNIWCGSVMVTRGRGTPLPSASPPILVRSGPYAIVRNPMAIAGLMQGLGVAIILASPTGVVYIILGGVVWNALVRPIEEHDLRIRFGEAFDAYARRVRCWWPIRKSGEGEIRTPVGPKP